MPSMGGKFPLGGLKDRTAFEKQEWPYWPPTVLGPELKTSRDRDQSWSRSFLVRWFFLVPLKFWSRYWSWSRDLVLEVFILKCTEILAISKFDPFRLFSLYYCYFKFIKDYQWNLYVFSSYYKFLSWSRSWTKLGPGPVIFLVLVLVLVPSYFWSRPWSRSKLLVPSHSGPEWLTRLPNLVLLLLTLPHTQRQSPADAPVRPKGRGQPCVLEVGTTELYILPWIIGNCTFYLGF